MNYCGHMVWYSKIWYFFLAFSYFSFSISNLESWILNLEFRISSQMVFDLANTAVINIQIFSRRYLSLPIMGFCFDWWILLLLTLTSITQSVAKYMMPRPLKTLYIILHLLIIILQTGSFNWGFKIILF